MMRQNIGRTQHWLSLTWKSISFLILRFDLFYLLHIQTPSPSYRRIKRKSILSGKQIEYSLFLRICVTRYPSGFPMVTGTGMIRRRWQPVNIELTNWSDAFFLLLWHCLVDPGRLSRLKQPIDGPHSWEKVNLFCKMHMAVASSISLLFCLRNSLKQW